MELISLIFKKIFPKRRDLVHLALVLLVVICLNLLAMFLADRYMLDRFLELEEEHLAEHVEHVATYLDREVEYLRDMLLDEAYRDETYEFAGNPQEGGFTKEFIDGIFRDDRISVIILTNQSGNILFKGGYDLKEDRPTPVNPAFFKFLSDLQAKLTSSQSKEGIGGILGVGSVPVLVTAAPVLRSDESGPGRGMLVFASFLSPGMVEHMGGNSQVVLGFETPRNDGNLPAETIIRRTDKIIAGRLTFPALLQGQRLWLEVSMKRGIYAQGAEGVRYFLNWTLAASLLFGLVGYLMLERMRQLSERETQRYRNFFHDNPIPMWVYDTSDLKFIDVNDAAIAQYGYSREEFLQKTILDFRPEDDISGVRAGVAQLLREADEGQAGPKHVGAWTHLRNDGSRLLADVSVVLINLLGSPAILATANDITEKVENEKALIVSEKRYRQLFQFAPLPMWVVDMDTLSYLDVNQTAIEKYGYSREEFLAMTVMDIRPPEDVGLLYAAIPAAKRKPGEQGAWRHRCKDGRILKVEIVLQDIPSTSNRTLRLVMANDITEKDRLRIEADRVSRLAALGELSAGIAHEINNPNGMLQINIQLIADVWRDLEPVLADRSDIDPGFELGGLSASRVLTDMPGILAEMAKGTRRIKDIVEDLKDFARQEDDSLIDEIAVNELVDASIRMVRNQIRKSGADFSCRLAEGLPLVKGNFRQLEQVVINLVLNACQALDRSGQELTVSSYHDTAAGEVAVVIKDGGVGIAPELLSRITEPFVTSRRESGGTGLGLSVSSRIVEKHGGRMEFSSQVGAGTRVELRLPILTGEEAS